jgi:hypothetical protein
VAVAEDVTGNKTSINNISGAPIEVTIDAAPASNSRIDVIVAYVDSTLQGSATVTDNYGVCGLITVSGTASTSPTAPSESAIRSAITADGAAGATAYYVVLAKITIASGTTDLTTSNISAGDEAKITSDKVDFATFSGNYSTSEQVTPFTWIDGKLIYKKTIYIDSLPNATTGRYAHGISDMDTVISIDGVMKVGVGSAWPLSQSVNPNASGVQTAVRLTVDATNIVIDTGSDRRSLSAYVTLLYTKI